MHNVSRNGKDLGLSSLSSSGSEFLVMAPSSHPASLPEATDGFSFGALVVPDHLHPRLIFLSLSHIFGALRAALGVNETPSACQARSCN